MPMTLDRASLSKLQAHAKSGGGPLEMMINLPSIPPNDMKSGGQPLQLSDEQIQRAILSQIPQLELAQRRAMPMPTVGLNTTTATIQHGIETQCWKS
jgi:hypothetical protein